MKKRNNSLLSMFVDVKAICDSEQPVWSAYPIFAEKYTAVSEKITSLNALLIAHQMDLTGYTDAKTNRRRILEEEGYALASGLLAYAITTRDGALQTTAKIPRSQFRRAADKALIGIVTVLADAAGPHLAGLSNLGIDAARLASIRETMGEFVGMADTPLALRNQKHETNKNLDAAIAEIRLDLKNELDAHARAIEWKEPAFVQRYFISRRIKDPARRTMALRLTIKDAGSKEPLSDVSVQIMPGKIKRLSSAKGEARIQNLREGMATINLSKEGYAAMTLSAAIVRGERNDLEVEMMGDL